VKAGKRFSLDEQRSKDYGLAGQSMKGFVHVYILVSEADPTVHYTGLTHDLEQRLLEHNRGKRIHTVKNQPWRIETAVSFRSESKARAFEKYLKSGSGREFARRHF
jgi:predicted GIY-YIG superfamily endonuclease